MSEFRVLCFGDSNTWGFVPVKLGQMARRYDKNTRWSGILQKLLGDNSTVVNAGLNSRTTSSFKGSAYQGVNLNALETFLDTYTQSLPLNLVIIMLGTNDVKESIAQSAELSARRISLLIDMVREKTHVGDVPKVLVISPVPVRYMEDESYNLEYNAGVDESKRQAECYKQMCLHKDVEFLDASKLVPQADGDDGVHLTAAAHAKLADAVYQKILKMF